MRRRNFIAFLGGAAAATASWTFATHAQQGQRVRLIALLTSLAEGAPEGPPRIAALRDGLGRLGWVDGRNVRLEVRTTSDPVRMQAVAKELVVLKPDVILVQSNPGVAAFQQATRTLPIVFVSVADPVASGFIESLSRPGGNITGFTHFEPEIGGKWLGALKEIAPGIKRVAAILHMGTAANVGFLRVAETLAPTAGVRLTASGVQNVADVDRKSVV